MMSPMGLLLLMVVVLLSRVTVFTQTSYNVIVTVGDNVILICSTSENIIDIEVVTVEWTRGNSFVLVFRDGKQVTEIQDSHFEGRAKLVYSDLKAGNLSMVLKNVTPRDNGIYICSFFRDLRGDVSQLSTTNLKVVDFIVTGQAPAKVGENVTLQCDMTPPDDISNEATKWELLWDQAPSKSVHVRRWGALDLSQQDPQFKNRVQDTYSELRKGTMSLTIHNVTMNDAGNYTCTQIIYDEKDKLHMKTGFVELKVESVSQDEQRNNQDSNNNGQNVAAIIGGVVAAVVLIAGTVLVLWWIDLLPCAQRYSETPQNDPQSQPQEVEVPLQQRPQEQHNNDELNPERDE